MYNVDIYVIILDVMVHHLPLSTPVSIAHGRLHSEMSFCTPLKTCLDDGTDCYFTCWVSIPGNVLGMIIHQVKWYDDDPSSYTALILLNGLYRDLHSHEGVSALPKICDNAFNEKLTLHAGLLSLALLWV